MLKDAAESWKFLPTIRLWAPINLLLMPGAIDMRAERRHGPELPLAKVALPCPPIKAPLRNVHGLFGRSRRPANKSCRIRNHVVSIHRNHILVDDGPSHSGHTPTLLEVQRHSREGHEREVAASASTSDSARGMRRSSLMSGKIGCTDEYSFTRYTPAICM